LQALPDRFGAERGEQRAEDAGVLERAQHGGIEGGAAAQEREDAFAAADAEAPQRRGETVALLGKVRVAQGVGAPVGADEPQRLAAAEAGRHVPVRRLVGDVQAPASRQSGELPPGLVPAERGAGGVVIGQMGANPEAAGVLPDGRPAERGRGSCRHGYIGRPGPARAKSR